VGVSGCCHCKGEGGGGVVRSKAAHKYGRGTRVLLRQDLLVQRHTWPGWQRVIVLHWDNLQHTSLQAIG
jgi:hypothetical protein